MHYTQVFNSHVVTAELARGIAQMPKVEIHVHLEGATSEELIFEMARRNHMGCRRRPCRNGSLLRVP